MHICTRCDGRLRFRAFQHIKNGVCFGCWGTGQDLSATRRDLQKRLQGLRQEYVKVSRHIYRNGPCDALEAEKNAIVEKGLALRTKLENFERWCAGLSTNEQ